MKTYGIIAVVALSLGFGMNNTFAAPPRPVFKSKSLPAVWQNVSPQQRLKALRVAQLDAYSALAERVYGFKLDSGSLVYDSVLQSDLVRSRLEQLLKGATEIGKPEYDANGLVTVNYAVKLRDVIEIIKTEHGRHTTTVTASDTYNDKVIEALGCGALPGSKGLSMLHARRAATLDAYRLMAERFLGVKINRQTTIADLCVKSDRITAEVTAFLKGLKPVSVEYSDDLSCEVKLQLKIRETVKTIENLVKTYNNGRKEKITNIDISSRDRIFTVIGNGAPGGPLPTASGAGELYRKETTIIRQIVRKKLVTE